MPRLGPPGEVWRTSVAHIVLFPFSPEADYLLNASSHAARHEASDAWMAVNVMSPNHCTAEAVWLCDNGAVRHVNPFVVDADAVTPAIGLPIHVGNYVPVKIGTALSELALQAFKPWLQRRVVV